MLGATQSLLLPLALILTVTYQLQANAFERRFHRRPHPQEIQRRPPIFSGLTPRFAVRPMTKIVTAGQKHVDFYCKPAMHSEFQVQWKILSPEGELIIGDHHEISPDGCRLRIFRPMEFFHNFQIFCILHSPFTKRPVQATARLFVMSPKSPHIVESPSSAKGRLGSRMVLECAARGWPAPKIAWMFISRRHHSRRFFDADGEYGDYIKEPNRLIITYMSVKTEGTYFCIAYNPKGFVKSRAQIGFDRRSPHRPHMHQLVHTVRSMYRSFHRLGYSARQSMNKKATCTMEISNQFLWTPDPLRRVDEKTLTYDGVMLWLRKNEKWPRDLPGEAKDVDVPMLKFLQRSLNCTPDSQPQPDCHKYAKFLGRYSNLDGSCNNFKNPTWGKAGAPLQRLLESQYEHGIFLPQGYQKNRRYGKFRKPSARQVSVKVFIKHDEEYDYLISQEHNHFGQILDHDLDLTPTSATNKGIHYQTDCNKHCRVDLPCFPIKVMRDDPRVKGCLSFKRSAAFCSTGVSGQHKKGVTPREQINAITSFIDANFVYGSSCRVSQLLREPNSPQGFLKTSPPVKGKMLRMLPIAIPGVPAACARHAESPDTPCYSAGDARANEFVNLLSIQTMFMREHNRIGSELHRLNPHWCPDMVFYEARRIVGAIVQQITFNEYLPLLLGQSGMERHVGQYKGYHAQVNPSVANVFAAAAFRINHINIADSIYGLNETFQDAFKPVGMEHGLLSPHYVANYDIDPSVRFGITMPMKSQHSGSPYYGKGIGDRMFELTSKVAADLGALDIQRGRDHGLPSYNYWRVFCGLQWASKWEHLRPEIRNAKVLEELKRVYGSPENVDLMTGLILEEKSDDSTVGPTSQCLLGRQFRMIRDGDRHWFENPGQFSEEQVQEIRRYTYSRLVCNTVQTINHIQFNAFTVPRDKSDLKPCHAIPDMDLMAWKERSHHRRCVPRNPCADEKRQEEQRNSQGPHGGPHREEGMRGPRGGPHREEGMRGPHGGPHREEGMRGPHGGPHREEGMRGPRRGPPEGPHYGEQGQQQQQQQQQEPQEHEPPY